MKFLIVEDDTDKLRRVMQCLGDVGITPDQIDVARDVIAAKKLLKDHVFDLLILDISLPDGPQNLPSKDAGVKLLDEILARDIYCQPREIIGLTAYDDVLNVAGARFKEDLWTVLRYESASDAWLEQIQRKIRYIQLARRNNATSSEHKCFLGIVTALHAPELSAVLDLPWSWRRSERGNDPTIYYEGSFQSRGETVKVVAASAPRMGMVASAVTATKLIESFRPRYLGMTGILAGIRSKCSIGDIIIADPTWDYGSGKQTIENDVPTFKPAPHQIALDSFLRSKLAQLVEDSTIAAEIQRSWTRDGQKVLKMHMGPVASGAVVLEDKSVTKAIQDFQHRKLIGIEMESYGVFAAALEATLPQPKAFVIKSVCDFGDTDKDDSSQAYAAFTSAQAMRIFAERLL